MSKKKIRMNKSLYLRLMILYINKTTMYIGIDITTQNQSMEIMQDYATLTRTEGQLHSLCKIRRCLCAPHKKC